MTARTASGPAWSWWVCGLLLLATMLNYMDRQTLSQTATDIGRELGLTQRGLRQARTGLRPGVRGRRARPRVRRRPGRASAGSTRRCSWRGRRPGFATGWAESFDELLAAGSLLGFFEAGQWPCALTASQRLLSRRDRALGNSVLQSGAAIGGVDHAAGGAGHGLATGRGAGGRRSRSSALMGVGWAIAWLAMIRGRRPRPRRRTTPRCARDLDDLVGRALRPAFPRPGRRGDRDQPLLALLPRVAPKMLREQHGYSRGTVNYFTSAFYIATDVGCLAAGFAVKFLASRGWSVHASRVVDLPRLRAAHGPGRRRRRPPGRAGDARDSCS